ncbi:MAG: type II toxin-antitoxin system HicB family antitoxin [Singulisphaera sp.]
MMTYKGYTGSVEVDTEAEILFGRVVGLYDVITFQGETVAQARKAFQDSVDDYLEFCAERGEAPEKPASKHFLIEEA